MTTAQDELKALLASHVAPQMKQQGYKRQGKAWVRRYHTTWQVVSPQSSRSSTGGHVKFTFNLGVHSDVVASLCNDTIDEKRAPSEAACHLRKRIGFLTPAHNDVWWDVHAHEPASTVAAEVEKAIGSGVLPFLDSINSIGALAQHCGAMALAPQCATILLAQGREVFHQHAQAVLQRATPRVRGSWEYVIESISRRAALIGL